MSRRGGREGRDREMTRCLEIRIYISYRMVRPRPHDLVFTEREREGEREGGGRKKFIQEKNKETITNQFKRTYKHPLKHTNAF